MAGSIFIYEVNEAKLLDVEIEKLNSFDTVELDFLTTVDFAIITGDAATRWTEGEPVKSDDENGLVIMRVEPEGLQSLLDYKEGLENFRAEEVQEDLDKLREFITRTGTDNIYELATF